METLNLVLSGELNDDVLRGVFVQQAEPAPDASRVLVTVTPLGSGDDVDPTLILDRLRATSKRLRAEVARSISRRKAPELMFRVALAGVTGEAPGEERS
jgi:ribosome-binding factor A